MGDDLPAAVTERPSRWQKARADTQLLRWKREVIAACVTAPVAFVFLKVFGSPDGAMDDLISVAAAVVAVLVLLPLSELAWNWLQAPHRIVMDEVIALRGHIALSTAPTIDRAVQLPLKERLVAARRQGRDIRDQVAVASYHEADEWRARVERWTSAVERALVDEAPDHLKLFSSAVDWPVDSSPWAPLTILKTTLNHRIAMLDQIIERLRG